MEQSDEDVGETQTCGPCIAGPLFGPATDSDCPTEKDNKNVPEDAE
jgi:hypothetical protein